MNKALRKVFLFSSAMLWERPLVSNHGGSKPVKLRLPTARTESLQALCCLDQINQGNHIRCQMRGGSGKYGKFSGEEIE